MKFCVNVQKEILEQSMQNFVKTIQFDEGKSTLKNETMSGLENLFLILKQNSSINIELEGHTDNVGSPEQNMILSQNRTLAIKNYLIKKGIEMNRISAVGYGDTKPLVPNSTDENKQKNRRVDIVLIGY